MSGSSAAAADLAAAEERTRVGVYEHLSCIHPWKARPFLAAAAAPRGAARHGAGSTRNAKPCWSAASGASVAAAAANVT